MLKLAVGELYKRQDVHKLFGGDSTFTPGAGYWGISGMLRTDQDKLSWVFYVTLGHKEGKHQFDESISNEGVLTWQSQPSKTLDHRDIKDLIAFNHDQHTIYLFLRPNKREDYQYLGRLSYLSHNPELEKPVYFKWQLLDWDNIKDLSFVKTLSSNSLTQPRVKKQTGLFEKPRLNAKNRNTDTKSNHSFSVTPPGSIELNTERRQQIGHLGELLVLEHEKRELKKLGCLDLIDLVEHSAQVIGDGLGYDVKSFNTDGTVKYIEVKTTTQSANADFYISAREVAAAERYQDSYVVYRVYDLNENERSASFFTINASELLDKSLHDMIPTHFRVSIKA